jgi:hypothetical protein
MRTFFGVGALVGAAALIAIGCGKTVLDTTKTEDTLEQNVEQATGEKVASVDCPSDVEVKKGGTFNCTVRFKNGNREVATLKIRNEDADLSVTDLRPEG